jgi:hypothetical protein
VAEHLEPPSNSVVRFVVAASIVITAFHFTDNAVSIEDYPQPGWITEAVVFIAWPLFSAAGVAAYLLYRDGKFPLANWFLLAYAFAGISSLGHFLSGSPDEFTTRGLISILADGTAGLTVLSVAIWSFMARQPAQAT